MLFTLRAGMVPPMSLEQIALELRLLRMSMESRFLHVEQGLRNLSKEIHMADATLTDIQQSVTAEGTVIGSVKTLLQQLSQRLGDAGADQAKLNAIKAQIDSQVDALAQAVVANTPAANTGAQPATPLTPIPVAPPQSTP